MNNEEKTTHTQQECCGDSNGSFDCMAMMQNFQKMCVGQSQEKDSFDCCVMMKKMCCCTLDGLEK
jgi:hypothetical protein